MRRLTRRQRLAAAILAALALGFIGLDLGGTGLSSAHSGVRGALGSLYRGTDGVLGPLRRFAEAAPHAASDEQRLRELQQQNSQLRKQLADARTDHRTASTLRKLRLTASSLGYHVLPARVSALGSGQGFDWTATLSVGRADGVRAGQTVTDGYALVGRVLHADTSSSVVLLGVDPGSGVGARAVDSGQLGVVTGQGVDGYTFAPLDPHAKLRVGERLVSGAAGHSSIVAGLTIGTLRSVHTGTDGSTEADVSPQSSPTSLDLVGVIVETPAAAKLAGGR